MTHCLFCYGTLQSPDVFKAVTGRIRQGIAARLPGYARFRVRDADYPGIIKAAGAETHGTLYGDISDAELSILDRFEGELYTRSPVNPILEGGRIMMAWAYVVSQGCENRLTSEAWDLNDFLRYGLTRFMQSYVENRRSEYSDT